MNENDLKFIEVRRGHAIVQKGADFVRIMKLNPEEKNFAPLDLRVIVDSHVTPTHLYQDVYIIPLSSIVGSFEAKGVQDAKPE